MINQFILLSCAFIVCSNVPSIAGLRILGLFPFQVRSHQVMCEELMRGLAMKGHQVDVYSHFPLKEKIPNYRDFSLRGSIPAVMNNVTFDVASITSISGLLGHWMIQEGNAVCNLLDHPHFQRLFNDPPKDPPYDLIINEISIINCFIAWGRRLNVPVIGVSTVSSFDWLYEPFASPINLATDPCLFSPYAAPMTFYQRLENAITYYIANRCYNQYIREQDKYITKYFGSDYPNAAEILKDISLLLINYDPALHGKRTFAPIIVPVGGLHVVDHNETLPKDVQKWLDESEQGCIYFSFGSMTRIETFPKHILDAFYKSFANILPVRVLLKVAKPRELPPSLPPNVMTQSWFDQIQVLKHRNIRGFVTHGGLMSTQESIYYGVPMIGIPLFGDQLFNVASYVQRNIAIKIDVHEITEKTVTDALHKIMRDPSYKEAAQRVSHEFKDHLATPMETAIYWTEYVARHGKDSLKSPASGLPWWEASLSDIYGLVVIVVTAVIYILFILMKRAYGLLGMQRNHISATQKKKNR